jgi:hypothetical protein
MRWGRLRPPHPNEPGGGLPAAERQGERNGLRLARIRPLDRARAGRIRTVHLGRDIGRAGRDRGRRSRRQSRWPAARAMGQLPRWLRRHPADLPGRRRDRPAGGPPAFLVQHEHRRHQLLRAISGCPVPGPLRGGLALAAGTDRRDIAVHDLGCRGLRGDGGDRLQSDRSRQDHPGRLLRDRPRHGPGPRAGVRQLQCVARDVHRRHRGGAGSQPWASG